MFFGSFRLFSSRFRIVFGSFRTVFAPFCMVFTVFLASSSSSSRRHICRRGCLRCRRGDPPLRLRCHHRRLTVFMDRRSKSSNFVTGPMPIAICRVAKHRWSVRILGMCACVYVCLGTVVGCFLDHVDTIYFFEHFCRNKH